MSANDVPIFTGTLCIKAAGFCFRHLFNPSVIIYLINISLNCCVEKQHP